MGNTTSGCQQIHPLSTRFYQHSVASINFPCTGYSQYNLLLISEPINTETGVSAFTKWKLIQAFKEEAVAFLLHILPLMGTVG